MMASRRELRHWSVWLDSTDDWADAPLDRLDRLPVHVPTGGWDRLDHGTGIDLPASTLDVEPEHHGVSWWSTEVELTRPGPVVLHFGAVRLLAEVFWDRERIAVDLEGYTPFEVRVPIGAATRGRHRLDLRVTNPGGSRTWEDFRPVAWGDFLLPSSHDFGGPWQPVTVHEDALRRIADVWVRADRDLRTVLVDTDIEAPGREPVRVEITDPRGATVAVASGTAEPGVSRWTLEVADAVLYRPGAPARYRCTVTLGDDDDVVTRMFGFRLLDYADGALRLNGEPIRLTSAISWGWYRRGPVPSPGDVERETDAMTAFGMNMLSAHRFPPTPALEDALEDRGLLLHAEPGGGATAPVLLPTDPPRHRAFVQQLMERRLRRLVRRDRSRACLVWWNVANEWGAADMRAWPEYVDGTSAALRAEDDSRLVTFTSGWGTSPLWRPFDDARDRCWDYHRVFSWPSAWNRGVEHDVEAFAPPESMLAFDGESACFTSIGRIRDIAASFGEDPAPEFAGWHWRRWVEQLEADLAVADPAGRLGGLDAVAAGTAEVQAHGFARLIESHRRQDWLHGVALNGWHQHHRLGTSGIVAPDRSPVCDPEAIRRAGAAVTLAFPTLPRVLRRGQPVEIRVERLGPAGSEGDVPATLVLLESGDTVWKGTAPHPVVADRAGLFDLEARHADLVVTDRVLVVDPQSVEGVEIAVLDPLDELDGWLREAGVHARPWRLHDPGPVLVVSEHSATRPQFVQDTSAGRIAVLTGRMPFGSVQSGFEVAPSTKSGPRTVVPLHGAWIGGWAFSTSDAELPSLGPPGVWGAERVPLFPARGRLEQAGRWITGFCSFPDADILDTRVPRLAATTWITELADGRDMLTTQLPVVERREDPLGDAVLRDLICWLASG